MPSSIARRDVARMIAGTIGDAKANEAVSAACNAAGMRGDVLTYEEALEVLGRVAETPGLVGITARFARSRMLLRAE